MHFLHHSSPVCCKSELDLFSMNPTQTSIEESNFISINPIHAVTNTDIPLEFNIPGTSDQYLDPSSIFLYLKVKLMNEDGSDLSGTDHIVYPTTNFLYSCFSQFEVYLNETSLGASAANYPYRCYIETLLNFSQDAKKSHLQSVGYYNLKDEPSVIDTISKRKRNTFEYYGRVHGDIFSQERLILPSVDVRIRLTRSPPQFALNVQSKASATTLAPKPIYQILDTYLYVRKVKLSPMKHLEIEKALVSSTAKYPINRVETKIFNFTQGLSTVNINNMIMGNLPKKVIIGIIDHSALSGQYSANPFKFKHHGLKELSLILNGQNHNRSYKMEYNDDGSPLCSRPFYELFANTISCSDAGTGIDLDSYSSNSNLYAFDLTADCCASTGFHLNIVKQGTLGLNLSFENPLVLPISILIYFEFQQLVELDRLRNVLVNF